MADDAVERRIAREHDPARRSRSRRRARAGGPTTTRRCRASRSRASALVALRRSSSSPRSRSCTSCCRRSAASRTRWRPDRARRPVVARRWRSCSRSPSFARLRRAVPRRLRAAPATPHRLARELPDHDGRPGGDAPVRRRRRGRRRADGVGAAALRACRGAMVADRMIAFLVLLYARLHGWRWSSAASGCASGIFTGAAPFAITIVPAIFGARGDRDRRCALTLVPDRPRAPRSSGSAAAAAPARPRLRATLATGPASLSRRRAHRAASSCASATRRCWARSPGGASTSAIAVGVASTRSATRRRPAVLVMAYFVGHARQPAAAAGRHRRRRRRHDRRVRRLRRAELGWRSSRCSTTAAFAFWLPTIPGAIAYLQLRRTVARWREERRWRAANAAAASVTA